MFFLKKLLTALALPPVGLMLAAFFGLWLERRYRRVGRSIVVLSLLAMIALSMPLVADSLLRSLENQPPISEQNLSRAQAIVVLGGGTHFDSPEYEGDTVGRFTLERVRYGAYLQKHSGLPILVSGGHPSGGRPEGELMKQAIERDLHGQVTWVESESRDTDENAAYSAVILKKAGISRIALVSHAWHLRRAIKYFEYHGVEVIGAPTGLTSAPFSHFRDPLPSADAFLRSSEALHEWSAIFVQLMMMGARTKG
jgi:uncharacterized SAM-binding protein YcdF (DUF218 family)